MEAGVEEDVSSSKDAALGVVSGKVERVLGSAGSANTMFEELLTYKEEAEFGAGGSAVLPADPARGCVRTELFLKCDPPYKPGTEKTEDSSAALDANAKLDFVGADIEELEDKERTGECTWDAGV